MEAAVAELCRRGEGVAAFDADGVLWRGDVGNSFLLWQIENHRLLPQGEREARRAWDLYSSGQLGDLELAVLCATCQRGLLEEQVQADARTFFEREFRSQIVPEVRAWVERLQQAGIEVWIVSGSHRWLVAAGAREVSVPDSRLLAVSTAVRDGTLTAQLLLPVPYGQGKARALQSRLRRPLDLALGNSLADSFMLELAALAVAFEPDAGLEELAARRGWPVVRFD